MSLALTLALIAQTCSPERAAMGHCAMVPAKQAKPAATPKPRAKPVRKRAPAPAKPAAAPMSGPATCSPEHAAMGHCTAAPAPAVGAAPPPPAVPATYADRVWGAAAMAPSRAMLRREHSGGAFSRIMIDRAEIDPADGGYRWEADGWFGGDIHRLVVKTEGEGRTRGRLEAADITALYSRAIDPYFNLQAGVRQAIGPGPARTDLAVGVEGLAPYWFDVEAHAYLSTKGELRGEVAADYDQRLTQRLILQPRVAFDLSAQDIPELGIGAGVSGAEMGLRLRYEFAREFAPYAGVVHERRWGGGERASTGVVMGVRAWF